MATGQWMPCSKAPHTRRHSSRGALYMYAAATCTTGTGAWARISSAQLDGLALDAFFLAAIVLALLVIQAVFRLDPEAPRP